MRSLALLLVLCGVAHALEDEPSPAPFTLVVPDASLRAVKDLPATICLRNGAALRARVLAFDATTVTVALSPSGSVVTIARAEVTELRMPELTAPPAASLVAAKPAPARERHLALLVSGPPGVMLDLDYRRFYAFANFPFILPAASIGGIVGMSFGVGASIPVSHRSGWKLDLFAFTAPLRLNLDGDSYDGSPPTWTVPIGVGLGAHCTFSDGFTIGVKVPILGGAVNGGSKGSNLAAFYAASAAGLPLLSMGYRF